MNNRTALILKLARTQNEKPSSCVTTTGSVNDWIVVREEEVVETELISEQAPGKIQAEKPVEQSQAEFHVCYQDNAPSNNPNVVTMKAMDHEVEAKIGPTVHAEKPVEQSKAGFQVGCQDNPPSDNPNVLTVRAMVHSMVAKASPSHRSPLVSPNYQNKSRPTRNRQVKRYFKKDHSSSESDDYDSDKDPMYAPDMDDDIIKTQKKRRADEVIAKISARRIQRSTSRVIDRPNENVMDFDPIEVMEEGSPEHDEHFEYNILDSNSDNTAQQKKGKKRTLNIDNWAKNKSKTMRNRGEAYTSSSKTKKDIPKKELKPPCKDSCRINCKTKISENERQQIFESYWALGDLTRQRDFLASHMLAITPSYQYKKEGSNRKLNHAFYFEVNDKRIRVCKEFFKNTLNINDRPIRTVISKKDSAAGGFVADDLRGKHNKHQTDEDKTINEGIRRHIESIPKVESHYLRANTSRHFIEGGKSIADLHRDYVDECKGLQQPTGTYKKYYEIFTKEYNISVFVPKKDQCELCHSYNTAEGDEKTKIAEAYERHIMEKDLSRLRKESDKESINEKVIVVCYDLQAVLPCPKGEVSLMYYKSKLNLLNLTVCELKLDSAFCYTWHEGEGGRGSCEIATCVYNYMRNKVECVKDDNLEFIFYSDNCSGQQKNKFVFSMYLYAVENLPIKSITHNFLIKGHSQNEGDNVHSMIEKQVKRCLKSGPIYHPAQYITLMKTAKKKGNPYKVQELSHEDFLDFKELWDEIGCNSTVNEKGINVTWNDIKVVRVEKDSPLKIKYKTTFDENVQFEEIFIQGDIDEDNHKNETIRTKKTRRSKTPKKVLKKCSEVALKSLYKSRVELSINKKKDLKYLVDKNVIPSTYAQFYNSLQ